MEHVTVLRPLILALVAGLALLPASPASAEPTRADRGPVTGHVDRQADLRRDLRGDAVHRDDGSRLGRVRLWSGRRITFHETIPDKWDWSLDRAIRHWNESGSEIRFVEVARARDAALQIGYGDTGGADGIATVGHQSRNFVRLSPEYKHIDATEAIWRVWVGRLFAHELGHVLGFGHSSGCRLMTPVFDFGCGLLAEEPGHYLSRWIDKAALRTFVRWYGGTAHRPPATRLIEALPPRLEDVAFAGGGSAGPVTVTWTPPAGARPGTRVVVQRWEATTCQNGPGGWYAESRLQPEAGGWEDPELGSGERCYRVWIENRYAAARPATTKRLAAYAPVPGAPAVGEPVWKPNLGGWRFPWDAPDGTTLHAMPSEAGCTPTAYDADQAYWLGHNAQGWFVWASEAHTCLTFYAVTDWGTVSPGTFVEAFVPPPAAPVVEMTWDPDGLRWLVSWLPEEESTVLRVARGPAGACATAYDDDTFEQLWEESVGTWSYYPGDLDGPSCYAFAAVDTYGAASAVTPVDHVVVPTP